MSVLYDNAIVAKRNVLNELRAENMTLQELRFLSIYLSKIDTRELSTRNVRFPLYDFQNIMGFGRLNKEQLKTSTDSLLQKIVHVPDENGRGMRAFQLFKDCHIFKDDNDEWFVEIDAHDRALPLMFEFKSKFFKYKLWNALRLKSVNQLRMYEILKQWESVGEKKFKVSELRELLGIQKTEYTEWQNFKVRVLDSCQQALKANTDLCFTYEKARGGRGGKWLEILFHIGKNEGYTDPLALSDYIDLEACIGSAEEGEAE